MVVERREQPWGRTGPRKGPNPSFYPQVWRGKGRQIRMSPNPWSQALLIQTWCDGVDAVGEVGKTVLGPLKSMCIDTVWKIMACPEDTSGLVWLQPRCQKEEQVRQVRSEGARLQVSVLQPHFATALSIAALCVYHATCFDLWMPSGGQRPETCFWDLGRPLVLLPFAMRQMCFTQLLTQGGWGIRGRPGTQHRTWRGALPAKSGHFPGTPQMHEQEE